MQRFHRTTRRSSLTLRSVAKSFRFAPAQYACVGVTDSPELVKHTKGGYKLFEASVNLGSGNKRFVSSCESLMCWKVHRLAGISVQVLDPGSIDPLGDPAVAPLKPQERFVDESGFDFARPGCIVSLKSKLWRSRSVMRVVNTVNEENRMSLILASIVGRGLHLEEGFFVEQYPDSSVGFTVRILRKASCTSRLTMRAARSKYLVSKYLRVLDPTWAL